MEKIEILNTDKLRILASIFWISGAVLTLVVALKDYNFDLKKNN